MISSGPAENVVASCWMMTFCINLPFSSQLVCGHVVCVRTSDCGEMKIRWKLLWTQMTKMLQSSLFTEIARVRASLFQINGVRKEPLQLPEPDGETVTLNEKVYVPVKEHPDVSIGCLLITLTRRKLKSDWKSPVANVTKILFVWIENDCRASNKTRWEIGKSETPRFSGWEMKTNLKCFCFFFVQHSFVT